MFALLLNLKWEVLVGINLSFDLFNNRFLREFVRRITVYANCLVRFGGTGMFAAAAADAVIWFHFRDLQRFIRWIRIGNHIHRLRRAVFGAGTAGGEVGKDYAVFFDKPGDAELGQLFLFHVQWQDGAARTEVYADRAIVIAVAAVEVQPRLHHTFKAKLEERRDEDPRRTGANAEMAGRAGGGKMGDTAGAGWRNRTCHSLGNRRRLALDNGLGWFTDAGEPQKKHPRVEQKLPSPTIGLGWGSSFSPPVLEAQAIILTNRQAIIATDTATAVHRFSPGINAARLADILA